MDQTLPNGQYLSTEGLDRSQRFPKIKNASLVVLNGSQALADTQDLNTVRLNGSQRSVDCKESLPSSGSQALASGHGEIQES